MEINQKSLIDELDLVDREELLKKMEFPKWDELFYQMFPIASRTFRNEYDGD